MSSAEMSRAARKRLGKIWPEFRRDFTVKFEGHPIIFTVFQYGKSQKHGAEIQRIRNVRNRDGLKDYTEIRNI